MKHVFSRMLGIEVLFTIKVEDFIKHSGPKITYTKQPLQNEFFIRSNDLLFQQGINDIEINCADWNGIPCFFRAGERSDMPFDIFSASFYLLSRYEEYIPHVKDIHGRFPPKESVAFKNGFLKQPVVDIWVSRLLQELKTRFPDLQHKAKEFKYTSVIDVTTSHSYAYRGVVRGGAAFIMDLGTLKLRRVFNRLGVVFGQKDPYDNFTTLVEIHKKHQTKSMFFFQFADYSTFDKNVAPTNNKFKFLIKSMADYSTVSLAASYSSFANTDLLKREKTRLESVINRPVNSSRMRYNRVDIPMTYRNLVKAEFSDDYTMGYTHEVGFRAGTCTPFFFYDINLEIQQPIRVHSFAVHDYSLVNFDQSSEMIKVITELASEVKKVKGDFITIFSNELLGGENKVNWLTFYESVISSQNV
ncbi:polysaccharide deacetylase family protein [Aurantibacter crassamenti]|uniref:polysaccharide deacetylase family protein n=1 Tax=Aurantibacter crassamenti TaxID=1837375 RepID=UPI001EED7393|nr:polysaccharide deacetylase family protein [Aurantibacter crassamenti]